MRWWRADRDAITAPRPWLVRTLTNLRLDETGLSR